MALDATERTRVAAAYMRSGKCPGAVTKPVLATTVGNGDDWLDSNFLSFKNALPAAFRNAATNVEIAEIWAFLLWRRIGNLRTDED